MDRESTASGRVGSPFFENLTVGEVNRAAPAISLTNAHAALHQAILGDRLRMPLDSTLSEKVIGEGSAALVHPSLVCDVAIGQSTLVTQRVIANLFYRHLVFYRAPVIGDTLRTSTEVIALRQNQSRPDRRATGLAVLRISTKDQHDRQVLHFSRCAMLPLRDPEGQTGHSESFEDDVRQPLRHELDQSVLDWDISGFREHTGVTDAFDLEAGTIWECDGGDVVSNAPELARLSLNIAMAHHDEGSREPRGRLVYGGHTIGLAAAQATRILPDLLTIVAWHSCDHLGPVFEGDTLVSTLELERSSGSGNGGKLLHLRSRVKAMRPEGETEVLDWRFVALSI